MVRPAAEQEVLHRADTLWTPSYLAEIPDFPEVPDRLGDDDTDFWASWSFNIHNLDNPSQLSAQLEAGEIIDKLPPLSLDPAPSSRSDKRVLVPMQDIAVQNADSTSNRFQCATAV